MGMPELNVRRTYTHCPGKGPQLLEEYQCFLLAGTHTEIKHGYYREYHPDSGQLATAYHYCDGQRHGQCEEYVEWGTQSYPAAVLHYRKGQRHGAAVRYAAWGKEQEGTYVHGLRVGRWVNHRFDGSLDVCHYKAGRLHGDFVTYGPDGREQNRLFYQNDKPLTGTRTEYYADGKTRQKISYAAGRRQKWSKSWYGLRAVQPRIFLPAVVHLLLHGSTPKLAIGSRSGYLVGTEDLATKPWGDDSLRRQ
ncbi:hypothetical protein BEN48_14830 [Hymenobacter glacialis]|uniref:Membrane-binding protein n=2 Tax=Hymenobacter glacialis TaxID=1908236 RepID=A0A1G1T335_9BACT|nr:hypothetical protein BEN48_14830 [Hymenobacter glacialis]